MKDDAWEPERRRPFIWLDRCSGGTRDDIIKYERKDAHPCAFELHWLRTNEEEKFEEFLYSHRPDIVTVHIPDASHVFHPSDVTYASDIRKTRRIAPQARILSSVVFDGGCPVDICYGKPYVDNAIRQTRHCDPRMSDIVRLVQECGVDGFVESLIDSFGCPDCRPNFARSLIEYILFRQDAKLFILAAPPGYGKTTMAQHLGYLCMRQMPKTTTRTKRGKHEDPIVRQMLRRKFLDLLDTGYFIDFHEFDGELYGIAKEDFDAISTTNRDHVIDTGHIEGALALRQRYPHQIRAIGMFPSICCKGLGLEHRLGELAAPDERFDSFQDQLRYIVRRDRTVEQTKRRLNAILPQTKEYSQYAKQFDLILDSNDINENAMKLQQYIIRGAPRQGK